MLARLVHWGLPRCTTELLRNSRVITETLEAELEFVPWARPFLLWWTGFKWQRFWRKCLGTVACFTLSRWVRSPSRPRSYVGARDSVWFKKERQELVQDSLFLIVNPRWCWGQLGAGMQQWDSAPPLPKKISHIKVSPGVFSVIFDGGAFFVCLLSKAVVLYNSGCLLSRISEQPHSLESTGTFDSEV